MSPGKRDLRKEFLKRIPEKEVVDEILQCAKARRGLDLWKQATGGARFKKSFVTFGIPGQPDLTGVYYTPIGALRIDVECKRPIGGKWSDDQKSYARRVRKVNGIYILATSWKEVADVLDQLDNRIKSFIVPTGKEKKCRRSSQ